MRRVREKLADEMEEEKEVSCTVLKSEEDM